MFIQKPGLDLRTWAVFDLGVGVVVVIGRAMKTTVSSMIPTKNDVFVIAGCGSVGYDDSSAPEYYLLTFWQQVGTLERLQKV
jgi:DNA-binding transcriptional regulator LsrR (DeoR family)